MNRIAEITEELEETLSRFGVNPKLYGIAIRITAETLYEREKAYDEYIAKGGRQTDDKGKSEATAVRLAAWNSQARACLGMLKLTPWRPSRTDDQEDDA